LPGRMKSVGIMETGGVIEKGGEKGLSRREEATMGSTFMGGLTEGRKPFANLKKAIVIPARRERFFLLRFLISFKKKKEKG